MNVPFNVKIFCYEDVCVVYESDICRFNTFCSGWFFNSLSRADRQRTIPSWKLVILFEFTEFKLVMWMKINMWEVNVCTVFFSSVNFWTHWIIAAVFVSDLCIMHIVAMQIIKLCCNWQWMVVQFPNFVVVLFPLIVSAQRT